MYRLRSLALLSALTFAAPAVAAAAEPQWGTQRTQPAYNEGYNRGRNAGLADARQGDRFLFTDESDYRRGDVGYRSGYGNRDRYRDEFRSGFAAGYRDGYSVSNVGRNGPVNRGGPNSGRFAVAYQSGQNDGYEEGLKDGRDGRRFDPIAESRYRSADHGYDRRDGPKEAYKIDYRVGFKAGYERGYQDGRRYDNRGRERGWFGF